MKCVSKNSEARIIKLSSFSEAERSRVLTRSKSDILDIAGRISPILRDIRLNGNKALVGYIRKFDGAEFDDPKDMEVKQSEIQEAYKIISPQLLETIRRCIRNVSKFAKTQLAKEYYVQIEPGLIAGRRIVPVDIAGLYVPGGKAVYPSVMIMLAATARAAGVKNTIVCTPSKDGKLDPATLVAADQCGVDRIFKIGGVQAIAAMAFGTETVPKVDVIAGPGGPYVSAAQKLLREEVRIDFPPGPSEGMVLADNMANPRFVAADMLQEAEHGPDSAGIVVTDSMELAEGVREEAAGILENLPEPRKGYIKENLQKYSCIIVAETFGDAIDFVNEYAPEHLQITCRNARRVLERIKNAGTVCVGAYSPMSVGNFIAGPNAVLPTGGDARFVSGVSVDTFLKKPTVEIVSRKGLLSLRKDIARISDFEGFPAHTYSVDVRFEKEKKKNKVKDRCKKWRCMKCRIKR